jgi:hypothetical protein
MNTPDYVKNFHWVKELKGKEEVKQASESMRKASVDLHILIMTIQDTNPEYAQKLRAIRKEMDAFEINLAHQFDGYIQYS